MPCFAAFVSGFGLLLKVAMTARLLQEPRAPGEDGYNPTIGGRES
jgi:hypothetical protein